MVARFFENQRDRNTVKFPSQSRPRRFGPVQDHPVYGSSAACLVTKCNGVTGHLLARDAGLSIMQSRAAFTS
jgi:hypothetical protein